MRGALVVVLIAVSSAAAGLAACIASPDVSGLPPYDAGTVRDGGASGADGGQPGTDGGQSDGRAAVDSSAADGSSAVDAGTDASGNLGCGPLDLTFAPVVSTTGVKGSPPPMDGGTIVPGSYVWASAVIYSADGGVPPASGRGAITFTASSALTRTQILAVDAGVGDGGVLGDDVSGYDYTTSGNSVSYQYICNRVGAGTNLFTATPTTVYIAAPTGTGGTIVNAYDIQ